MKKILNLIILILTNFNMMFGQSNNVVLKDSDISKHPIYMIDNEEVSELATKKINPKNILKINILKDEKAKEKYGERATNGIVLIETTNLSKLEVKNLQMLYAVNFSTNKNKDAVVISGIIVDCEDLPIINCEIRNLNTNEKILNSNDGKFLLKCNQNDVISFKAENTDEERILVDKNNSNPIIKLKQKEIVTISTMSTYKKPVIYLYPEKTTDISLKFVFNGKILTTFPKYENSWEVISNPDGKIYDKKTKRTYNSLFWDGERNFGQNELEYKEGFIVERKKLVSFLIEKLETIGLNNMETNDFIQFWLPILEQNEFNFIHFRINDQYNIISKNIIQPEPETSIRVMMEFHKVYLPYLIPEQKLINTKRKGFTLVEWGGVEIPENAIKKNL